MIDDDQRQTQSVVNFGAYKQTIFFIKTLVGMLINVSCVDRLYNDTTPQPCSPFSLELETWV